MAKKEVPLQSRYLSINMSNDDFYNLLKHSINNNLPLSFSRYGDGDLKYLNGFPNKTIEQRFCRCWGFKWPSELNKGIKYAKKIIITSLQESDVIGILDKDSIIAKRIKYSPTVWSLSFDQLKEIGLDKPIKVCDHQITRSPVLGDIHKFKTLLGGKAIHIVSSKTAGLKKNKIDQLIGVHVNYTQIDFYTKLNDQSRRQMFKKLDKITEPIVLIALSIIGKDVPVYLKNRGKICLDMGATIDAWSGHATRTWFKPGGLQHYCLINNN